ncbi:twin-arginine translocation signal domain-containing protein [Deltaproteobacteria bacterium]|nr:twin-arginine translocation signal domain-containing protein [Deltaproteobacteria bacterium]
MNRRDFLKGLLGGAAVLSLPQAKAIEDMLAPTQPVIGMMGPPEFVGKIPVRTELTVLPADNPAQRAIGWRVEEVIGIGAYNPRGLAGNKVRRMPDLQIDDADIHLCSATGSIHAIHEYGGQIHTISEARPRVGYTADPVAALADLPDSDPEQTTRFVEAVAANFVRVDGLGWVQLAA